MKNIIFIFALALYTTTAVGQEIFIKDGLAIGGYDPVAYFNNQKPVRGKPEFAWSWMGAKWQFASKANLEAFKSQPDKYSPQYGGYCAYGMSDGDGHKASTLPETFTIVDGKLYLNYNLKVKEIWLKDQSSRIDKANRNWPAQKSVPFD